MARENCRLWIPVPNLLELLQEELAKTLKPLEQPKPLGILDLHLGRLCPSQRWIGATPAAPTAPPQNKPIISETAATVAGHGSQQKL